MAELAIGLQRPVCSIVEIGKPRMVMLPACPSAIDRPLVQAGRLGIGLLGYLVVLRSLLLDRYLL
ncbi:hypothetical protein LV476_01170 [Guyparkeria hydrothermalis]|uniref:hypothetical protein n=1 Tax=Guyparkeria hydrothermalis TaxID=923 RepID=UPI0020221879|nr:hypothetical protein [Guyparkeria hydrothermalis]MCL7743561.1 hypothetical protein [Guyparkeria hydrothermalis]